MSELKPVAWKVPLTFVLMFLSAAVAVIVGIASDNGSFAIGGWIVMVVLACTVEIIEFIEKSAKEG
jgi:hypothetical protein